MAHALGNTLPRHPACKPARAILDPSIRMDHHAANRTSLADGPAVPDGRQVEGRQERVLRERMANAPSQYAKRPKPQYSCNAQIT